MNALLVLNHPGVLRPICTVDSMDGYGFILEHLQSVTIADKYFSSLRPRDKSSAGQMSVNREVMKFAAQVLDLILYIHWMGFSHSDLKGSHIFRKSDGQPVVIDFEEAVRLPAENNHRTVGRALSPEAAMRLAPLQENIDMWAFGTMLAHWHIRGHGEIVAVAKTSNSMHLYTTEVVPAYFSRPLRQILFYLLQPDPALRKFNTPGQIEFLQSLAYWEGIDWVAMRQRWGRIKLES